MRWSYTLKCDSVPYKEETLKCDGLIRQSAMVVGAKHFGTIR